MAYGNSKASHLSPLSFPLSILFPKVLSFSQNLNSKFEFLLLLSMLPHFTLPNLRSPFSLSPASFLVLSKSSTKALSQICQKLLCRCNCASRMTSFFSLGMRRDCFAFADSFLLFAKWSMWSLTDSTVCKIKVAFNSHAPALYFVAVIQFNGSSGTKNDKDLKAGVANCD